MRMIKFRWILTLLLLFGVGTVVNAQTKVAGVVMDSSGEGMPGVNVMVKGTTNGTITDLEGKFQINAPAKTSILVVSFVGYKAEEIKIGNQTVLKVVLKEDALALDEVVISAGYTEVRRRDFTGAAGKANIGDMLKAPVASFDQALAGRVAGVQVSSNQGGPGEGFNIVIRGNNSLTQSNAPLYVIDGFPQESSNASVINPSDIESIDILKDASSTAIYGARGANGVVIITTKKGAMGKPVLTYNGSFSVQNITKTIDLLDPYEFVKLQSQTPGVDMDATWFKPTMVDGVEVQRDLEYYRNVPYYNWQDELFRTANTHNHYASLNGGKEGTRYSVSLSYMNQEGVILNSDFERYQGRFSLDQKINNKLTFNINTNYTRAITNGTSPSSTVTSSATSNLMYSVWGYRPVTYDGTDLLNSLYDPAVDQSNDYRFNPILSSKEEYKKRVEDNLSANGYLEYSIIKGLKAKVSAGYRLRNVLSETFNNSKTRFGSPNRPEGVNASMSTTENRSWLNENTLAYSNTFQKHNVTGLVGITFQEDRSKSYSASVQNMIGESLGMAGLNSGLPKAISSGASSSKLMSYLGRATYNYDSKYYATASFRADGSSKFIDKNRWGYFPSASVAWNFFRESFIMDRASWMSNGKLRVSWGLTGNNRVSDFAALAKLSTSLGTEYVFDNSYYKSYALSALPNKDLKWETTEQYNIGLDLSFLKDRIGLTMDVYQKETRDLLLNADLPVTTGYGTAYKNIGKMRNRGLEITIDTKNIQTRNFSWSTNFNISFNKGTIQELNEGQETLLSTVAFDNGYKVPSYIAQVGQPVGLIYGFVFEGTYKYEDFDGNVLKPSVPNNGMDRKSIKPGMPRYKDINEDGVVNDYDRTIIGRGHPVHMGGFTNNFTYKGFDLSVFFQWSYGNDIINANRLLFESGDPRKDTNMFASYADRWSPENPTSDIPGTNLQGPKVFSSRVIEDGSYLRLKTVSLGYNVPANVLKKYTLSSARIFVSGENLVTFSSYSGYDPEVSVRNSALTPGFDYSAYPRAYNFSLGLNIGF